MTETKKPVSPMDFEAMTLFTADHATVENGKVYVNGGFWDTIFQPSFPALVSVALVAVIKVPSRAFLEDHRVTVEMVDADEQRLPVRIDGSVRVGPTPYMNPGEPSTLPLAFLLNGVSVERTGDYWFVLSVDDGEIARYRIRLVQTVPVPQTTSGNAAEEQ